MIAVWIVAFGVWSYLAGILLARWLYEEKVAHEVRQLELIRRAVIDNAKPE